MAVMGGLLLSVLIRDLQFFLEEGKMILPHVFISYSREQFYYVESLVLRLQSLGVSVWFDVQCIHPGSDWQQSIEDGLDLCTGLVLIVSNAALSSEQVEKEWKRAVSANKPIYVVLFEAVRLPDELKYASIIDMRSNFEGKAQLLAQLILTKRTHYDRFPRGNRYHLPTPMSFEPLRAIVSTWLCVLLYLIGLTIISVILLVKISLVSRIDPSLSAASTFAALTVIVNWVFFTGYALFHPWMFTLRKRFDLRTCTFCFYALPVNILALLGFDLEFFQHVLPQDTASSLRAQYLPVENELALVFVACGFICSFLAIRLLQSGAGLRWFRTGSAPDYLRSTLNKKWLLPPQAQPVLTATKTYRLHYHPMDRHIADEVIQALEKSPNLQRGTNNQVDYHIAILTSKISVTSFNQLLKTTNHLVCVIATSIHLPKDKRPLLRLQWIDYRKRLPEQLTALTALLNPSSTASKGYNFSLLPESLENMVTPDPLSLLCLLFRFIAALNVGMSVFLLLVPWQIPLRAGVAILPLLVSVYLFYIVDKLELCDITRHSLGVVSILALVCTLFFDALSIFMIPNVSVRSFLSLLTSNVTLYTITMGVGMIPMIFFINRKTLSSRKVMLCILLYVASLFLCNIFDRFTALEPGSDSYWIYNIKPSTIIALVFTAFLLGLPLTWDFSPSRIRSLLPSKAIQFSRSTHTPTLTVPRQLWLTKIAYIVFSLEIAFLFLTEFYASTPP